MKSDFTGSTVSSSFWEQVEDGQLVEFCSDRYVDHMPCHDPKRAVKLSRERNFYKERHCPPAAEKLNCLIPSPPQYQRPIPWPESLRKVTTDLPRAICLYLDTLYDASFMGTSDDCLRKDSFKVMCKFW